MKGRIRVEILRLPKSRKPTLNRGAELRLGRPRVACVDADRVKAEARPRIVSRVGAGSDGGGQSRRENSNRFIHDVGLQLARLEVIQAATG